MNRIDPLILRRKHFTGPVLVLAAMVGPIIWCVEAGDAATLTVTARHGSVIVTPHKAHYESGEVVELLTIPDVGYCFAGWGGDARGKRLVLNLAMEGDKTVVASFGRWQAPIGIPEPPFGIHETHHMYANGTYDFGFGPQPYHDAGNGPYTHYVDSTHARATNSDNPFGTAKRPRKSFPAPSTIGPGAVIEMQGGPYRRDLKLAAAGTTTQPVFVRGSSSDQRPVFYGRITVSGHYVILENLNLDRHGENSGALKVRPKSPRDEVHHVSIRNCEIHNFRRGKGSNTTVMNAGTSRVPAKTEDVVFYNNHIHPDCMVPPQDSYERDLLGIGLGYNCNRVWVVDNHIHHLPGDCVGGGHSAEHTVTNFYIGRNILHDTSENAIDLKEADGVFVSENLMYNFAGGSGGSRGVALVVHYGRHSLSTKNVWILYNEIHSAKTTGIQIGGGQHHDVYIIGNVVHDIHNGMVSPYLFESFDQGRTIYPRLLAKGYIDSEGNVSAQFTDLDAEFRGEFPQGYGQFPHVETILRNTLNSSKTAHGYRTWNSQKVYLVGNNFFNVDNGIKSHVETKGSQLILRDTIVSRVADSGYHLSLDGSRHLAAADICRNIFHQATGPARIVWDGRHYGVRQFQHSTGKGEGCLDADPQFVNPKDLDFRLRSTSPAIDAGQGHSIYELYGDRYGIDIFVDRQDLTLPQGRGWDIGAFEHPDDGKGSGEASETITITVRDRLEV